MEYKFIVNTENVNSYGYRILTDGIDTSQYEKNPVVLFMHNRGDHKPTGDVAKNTESTTNQVMESRISYRDTVFYTPKAEARINIPVSDLKKCSEADFKTVLKSTSEPKTYTQKNGNATAIVKILHDTLTVMAECDSIALTAKIKKEYYKDYQEKVKLNDQLVDEQTKTNWQMIIALITIAFIAGFVTKSLIKISI